MTHLWVRSEQRNNERRVGLTPDGAARLRAQGVKITVEHSPTRIIPIDGYRDAGCSIAPTGSWPEAPKDTIIFGLKELPDDGSPLPHRHIMFGHAFKQQPAGRRLLDRFVAGGGTLYDLEYLTDDQGRRVAAFGYWAGFVGAAMAFRCWNAQQSGRIDGPVDAYPDAGVLTEQLKALQTGPVPRVLIIGALGRVGTGAADLCTELGLPVTKWDMVETAKGGPFPEVLDHDILLNAILARPGCPVFVPASATTDPRRLRVIGDIACDPESAYSPIKVYDRTTTWAEPALRVHDDPPLDVTAIDNLPSLLPLESSMDFAAQLLPTLMTLPDPENGVWTRAAMDFIKHSKPPTDQTQGVSR